MLRQPTDSPSTNCDSCRTHSSQSQAVCCPLAVQGQAGKNDAGKNDAGSANNAAKSQMMARWAIVF